MKIAFITALYPPDVGGPAVYVSDVSSRLRHLGHEVEIVTTSTSAAPEPGLYILTRRLPPVKYLRGFLRLCALFVKIARLAAKVDVIFVQSPGYVAFVVFVAAKLRRKGLVIRFPGDVAWEHAYSRGLTHKGLDEFLREPDGGRAARWLMSLQRIAARSADKVIAPSQYMRDAVVQAFELDPCRAHAIYHSVDSPDTERAPHSLSSEEAFNIIQNRPAILYVGRLVRHKRVVDLVEAMKLLRRSRRDGHLYIAGDGAERDSLMKKVTETGLDNHVSFLGDVSRGTALALMSQADVLVLPSLWESLSHVAIEAMACGTPIVSTNIRGLDEVLEHEKTALLVDPCNPIALSGAIQKLLDDHQLRLRLSQNGKDRVSEQFSWSVNLPNLIAILQCAAERES
jgi:glycosyltransferase involved in cell wall biosynthesis